MATATFSIYLWSGLKHFLYWAVSLAFYMVCARQQPLPPSILQNHQSIPENSFYKSLLFSPQKAALAAGHTFKSNRPLSAALLLENSFLKPFLKRRFAKAILIYFYLAITTGRHGNNR